MFNRIHINDDTEDDILFRLIQKGNKRAFTIAYERYNKMLYALAFRYLKERLSSEDIIQQVFAKFWEYHSDISISISLRNYLYTMTKNLILNQIRDINTSLIRNYQIAQSEDSFEDNLLSAIEEKELMSIFYQAINMLPEQKKTVCILKMEEKMSNQDIAKRMDISINTVKTHYAQAIKLLRSYIEKMLIIIISIILS